MKTTEQFNITTEFERGKSRGIVNCTSKTEECKLRHHSQSIVA